MAKKVARVATRNSRKAATPAPAAARGAAGKYVYQFGRKTDGNGGMKPLLGGKGDYREAFAAIAALQPAVATFFDDVLVMAEDGALRDARLGLVATLRDLILGIADISEIVTD